MYVRNLQYQDWQGKCGSQIFRKNLFFPNFGGNGTDLEKIRLFGFIQKHKYVNYMLKLRLYDRCHNCLSFCNRSGSYVRGRNGSKSGVQIDPKL